MNQKYFPTFPSLRKKIIGCHLCPRLVEFREQVPCRKAFLDQEYWRKPVPGYGDPNAWLLIVGLAPAAQGANRTGRVFTGDLTSKFLVSALYEAGFANQPTSEHRDDGLQYTGCYLTPVVKCVPPHDKPLPREILNCNPYFQNELKLLKKVTHVLALGKTAFDSYRLSLRLQGHKIPSAKFAHGHRYDFGVGPIVYASYHPSPQNTNTGKLTRSMFLDLLSRIIVDHAEI